MSSKKKPASASTSSLDRNHSAILVDGPDRAASRAMLHAVGFQRGDFKKNQIGIASTWSQVTPCNIHIDKLAIEAAKGVDAAGGRAPWQRSVWLANLFAEQGLFLLSRA